jgi:hypothetical protein
MVEFYTMSQVCGASLLLQKLFSLLTEEPVKRPDLLRALAEAGTFLPSLSSEFYPGPSMKMVLC